jgi:signal transduction histidine kinase
MTTMNEFNNREALHVLMHDLRAPTALILGYIGLIQADIEMGAADGVPAEWKDYLDSVARAAERIKSLTDTFSESLKGEA